MTYLVFRKSNNKLLKQFNDYKEAFDYCKEKKNQYSVALVQLDTATFKTHGTIIF